MTKPECFGSTVILINASGVHLPLCLGSALLAFFLQPWVEVSNLGKKAGTEQLCNETSLKYSTGPDGAGLGAFSIVLLK